MKWLNALLGYIVLVLFVSFIIHFLLGSSNDWFSLRFNMAGVVLVFYLLSLFLKYKILPWLSELDSKRKNFVYKWIALVLVVVVILLNLIFPFNSGSGGGGYGDFLFLLFLGLLSLLFTPLFFIVRYLESKSVVKYLIVSLFILLVLNMIQLFTLTGLFE